MKRMKGGGNTPWMFVMWGIVYNWRKIDCLQSKCRKAASARPSDSETSSDVINAMPKVFNSDKEDTQPHGSLEKQHTQGGRKMIGGLSPSLFDRGRAADARPKVGRRRRRRSPNISYDLILSPQFLLLPQSSLRSQTKSQLVAEGTTDSTHTKQAGAGIRGVGGGVEFKSAVLRSATTGERLHLGIGPVSCAASPRQLASLVSFE